MLGRAVCEAFVKLDPRRMVRNPVMFVVEMGSLLATVLWLQALLAQGEAPPAFVGSVAAWLWFTVLFANFAEALAEGRGKARARALRRTRQETTARRMSAGDLTRPERPATYEEIPATDLRQGDLFLAQAGDIVAADGEVVRGIAMVDESAVTGESAPVVREPGGDRSAVTGGTRVISDWLVVRVSANPGQGFLDRMIALVEGAKRRKPPNELALSILLAGFTLIFLTVCATLLPFSRYSVAAGGAGQVVTLTALLALLVCLIPTTIGGLLPAIGIAGMERLIQRNVIALSGRAVEAAGDVDVLLLDKTGTITLGNREAVAFVPVAGTTPRELAETAQLASLADETPEGRSIVELAKREYGLRGRTIGGDGVESSGEPMHFITFTAQSRMSGVDCASRSIRKGAPDAIAAYVGRGGNEFSGELQQLVDEVARSGGTPLVVAEDCRPLGVVHLKDIVKGGIRERFAQLRRMGIRTVMITGDNQLTATAVDEGGRASPSVGLVDDAVGPVERADPVVGARSQRVDLEKGQRLPCDPRPVRDLDHPVRRQELEGRVRRRARATSAAFSGRRSARRGPTAPISPPLASASPAPA
ncbi:MAG: potassium-transporting ATPase subunit KdpB [Armatimonadetes bacterium]|nr:potassium-transporting ATPase subunit KdpB [Armatimonadota bacterium]